MGLKQETEVIGGMSVTVQQLPAVRAFKLLTRLGKAIAPALDKLDGISLEANVRELVPALRALFENLDDEEAATLARRILESTVVDLDGKRYSMASDEGINSVFSGKLGAFFEALGFSVRVQFADFFEGGLGAGLLDKAREAAGEANPSDSPTSSPTSGQSGDSGQKNG